MKKIFSCALLFITLAAQAQVFPGLSEKQKQQLLATKTPMPLPTWLPEGYSVTGVITKTGKKVLIQDKVLTITYGKKLANGRMMEFKVDAGFDGIGDLMYTGYEILKSKAGKIYLYYEPYDEDSGTKKRAYGLIMTEWFDVNNLAFNVVFSTQGENERENKVKPKISKADAKKVLLSMAVLR